MAVVRYAEGQQRSGHVGASVYSHNRFGQYIRTRSIPVNPKTTIQEQARQRFALLAVAWNQTLTQAQRDLWDAYAAAIPWTNAVGDQVNLTGLNMFIRTNTLALQGGLTVITAAPAVLEVAQPPSLFTPAGDDSAGELSIVFAPTDPWATEAGGLLFVFQGLGQTAARTYYGSPWRFAGTIVGATPVAPTSPETFPEVYPLVAGQRVFSYCRVLRADGRVSAALQSSFLVVA